MVLDTKPSNPPIRATHPLRTLANQSLRLSWGQVEELLDGIVMQIGKDGIKPDTIIAIARGGLVPGRMLAGRLGVTNMVVWSRARREAWSGERNPVDS